MDDVMIVNALLSTRLTKRLHPSRNDVMLTDARASLTWSTLRTATLRVWLTSPLASTLSHRDFFVHAVRYERLLDQAIVDRACRAPTGWAAHAARA